MKQDSRYEPHLVVQDMTLPPGGEWVPRMRGWALIQAASGAGYWMHPRINKEIETGALLLLAGPSEGSIRSSQLGELALRFFRVEIEGLTGLMTVGQQRFFSDAASKSQLSTQVLPPQNSLAIRFKELCETQSWDGISFKIRLLLLFVDAFEGELKQQATEIKGPADATDRLREFLQQTPTSALVNLDFSKLVRMAGCTPRHASRVFREVVGVSFREKQSALRLALARELLATTPSKVVDVALESGFRSLSLFNLMFKRHHGVSPAQWREMHRKDKGGKSRARLKVTLRFPKTPPARDRTTRRTDGEERLITS